MKELISNHFEFAVKLLKDTHHFINQKGSLKEKRIKLTNNPYQF
jgi:hypothetical protein